MTPDAAPPQLFVIAHNRNHVAISGEMAALVRASGVEVRYVVVEGHPDRDAAASAAAALKFEILTTAALEATATRRDIICLGNDWGPKHLLGKIQRMRRRGVRFVGFVEGARFAYPKHYERVDDLLVWGQSGLEVLPGRKHVVGSPAVERASRQAAAVPKSTHVLINYKFTKGAMQQGPGWARACASAAIAIDPNYILTAHPSNVADLAGLNVSHAPFSSLIAEATLLITRSSTVIYEALAAGVNVIYFPLEDERRAEFGEAFGAFKTAESAADVARFALQHAANPAFDAAAASAFLTRHVSFDASRSASQRMADFMTKALGEQAQFAATAPQRLDIGRLWRWMRPERARPSA